MMQNGVGLTRSDLFRAWERYYSDLPVEVAENRAEGFAERCERKMRLLGKHSVPYYKGYDSRELNKVLSMALSVHKQVLGRLTSSFGGVKMKGWREG